MRYVCISLLVLIAGYSIAGNVHVSPHGSHIWPYDSWDNASTDMLAAVSAASNGDTIFVTNGVYDLSDTIYLLNGIHLQSCNGATHTTVDAGRHCRAVYLSHSNAIVDGFTIQNGSADTFEACGAGVSIVNGGLVKNCIIRDNQCAPYMPTWGGGCHLDGGGILRNCLIVNNIANTAGGVFCRAAGLVENCTIVDNQAYVAGGFSLYQGGTVRNSIIFGNVTPRLYPEYYVLGDQCLVTYSCTKPLIQAPGNIDADPGFISSSNYSLSVASPCIEAADVLAWMSSEYDITGSPRIQYTFPDMGACEYVGDVWNVDFSAMDRRSESVPHTEVFRIRMTGTNLGGALFDWDFDGDSVWDIEGVSSMIVTNIYANEGLYTVRVRVNSLSGHEGEQVVKQNYVHVGPALEPETVYVSTDGNQIYPYTNWWMATRHIQSAVDVVSKSGGHVWVSNGTYTLTQRIMITNGITVQSVNGYRESFVDGAFRDGCIYIAHSNAVLDGFTITNGNSSIAFYAFHAAPGEDVTVTELESETMGGGVGCHAGALVRNCRISGNQGDYYGGGAYIGEASTIVNCLVDHNSAHLTGSGVYCDGGAVRFCTIVDNINFYQNGAGISIESGGEVVHSIIYYNDTSTGVNYDLQDGNISNCCTAPALPWCFSIDPWWPRVEGQYALTPTSLCIDLIASADVTEDIDRTYRPLDGDANGVAYYDVGAFEYVDADSDTDGDGMNDQDEVNAGMNPGDGDSVFEMNVDASYAPINGDGYVVQWCSAPGKFYQLLRSVDLMSGFEEVAAGIPSTPPINAFTDTTASAESACFYRVEVE